jgi:ACR3 family arsenite transporter
MSGGPQLDRRLPPPTSSAEPEVPVMRRLPVRDRFLPLWVGAAMLGGLALGALVPGLDGDLNRLSLGTISLPIALGLLLMMYPILAKVRYEELGRLRGQRRLFVIALTLNWLVAPAVMFALAWLLLPDQASYRTGLIIVGIAPCIAMVLVWNNLAEGDNEAAAILVAINALIQVVAFAALAAFYLETLPGWLGLQSQGIHVSVWEIARTVVIFLGIPLLAGYLTRRIGIRRRGRDWYEERLLPRLGPLGFWGLLFTIAMLFAIQGDAITANPLRVARIALPLVVYFAVMFVVGFAAARLARLRYPGTATVAFTAASNNFDLAIAVAVGVWGVSSGQALASVVGPLIEVPVQVSLVYVALWARGRLFAPPATSDGPKPRTHTVPGG